jgi:RNA polymerase sigma factor (sigma-70 family)
MLFKDRVYNIALGYLQNAEDAEEIVQDVFVEVFNAAHTFKGQSSISTWIYRIAVNKCLDALRYRKRKKRFALIVNLFKQDFAEAKHGNPHFEHPGILLENKEKSALLFAAIDTLPEQQKTAFVLSYVEELPQKEVAEILGISVKAVESLIQRAKGKLRKELLNNRRDL